jgi:hypothetical protein
MKISHCLPNLSLIISHLTVHEVMRSYFWVAHGVLAPIMACLLIGLCGFYHVRFETLVPTPGELLRRLKDLKQTSSHAPPANGDSRQHS